MGKISAFDAILQERARQITEEGWTLEHDDQHSEGEMLRAGVIYLWHGTDKAAPIDKSTGRPMSWPWGVEWWKPKDRAQNVIRAGALFQAEKERRERAGWPTEPAQHKLNIAVRELSALGY